MSGIAGIFHRNDAPVDRATLEIFANFLSYRGPDAKGAWRAGNVGFAHAVLRTAPHVAGETHPTSLAEHLWIVSDARIDERADLIAALNTAGSSVNDQTPDSELILHSYDVWGDQCTEHLRGDFAFAIWDAHEKALYCARDHFGVKPFYYVESRDLFAFSNTLVSRDPSRLRAYTFTYDSLLLDQEGQFASEVLG